MTCGRCLRLFRFWWLALALAVLSCGPLPAPAQTPIPPATGALSPSERSALARASVALLTRLLESSQQISDLKARSQTLSNALTDSRQESDGLRTQLEESETSRKDSEAALTETSNLLDESRRDFMDLKQSTDEAREAADRALERALSARDWWMYYAFGATAVASLLGLYVVFHALP